ncbi:MAG: glucosamine-6-phosphate deaminase [Rhodothermales bacterium]|nr:glucosamine-6-phosphate deaminase [Rhodothermales bacterium]
MENFIKKDHIAGAITKFERVPVRIFDDSVGIANDIAEHIANLIRSKAAAGEKCVLGLPTGSTPIGVYQRLVNMHNEEGLDFSTVVTFNLDEYYPMEANSIQSYHRFMRENFFDWVNVPDDAIHIPDGSMDGRRIDEHCAEYESLIRDAGGIDLMLLGIGRSGHIGFNEPGSTPDDRTRLIVLDEITRKDAASDFFEEKYVPREAITMGVGTILEAREIILMATGEHKAPIIKRAVEEAINQHVSATYLQGHENASFYLDRAAASDLTRVRTPWLVSQVRWNYGLAKRAVIWVSEQADKAIPQLSVSDFHRHHLHDLVHSFDGIDELCLQVFEDLRQRILYRQHLPRKSKVIVFSPHPDDDVISMGGMLGKLVENHNEVVVAYMTNGSVAVFDQDVRRHVRFLEMAMPLFSEQENSAIGDATKPVFDFLGSKKPAQVDTDVVQRLKAYIRYTEAIAGIEVMGLDASNARFLDLPFYKTGRVKKAPIGEEDVQIILDLFTDVGPTEVFVAGDLSDPHGTHRMCYSAIKQALAAYNRNEATVSTDDDTGFVHDRRPRIWLYRGAWQEWEIDRADVFVPMTKADLDRKIEAIYKHESQKDRALFPGAYDEREFWQRARDRNQSTAKALDAIGLPEFHAAEAYVTCYEIP